MCHFCDEGKDTHQARRVRGAADVGARGINGWMVRVPGEGESPLQGDGREGRVQVQSRILVRVAGKGELLAREVGRKGRGP